MRKFKLVKQSPFGPEVGTIGYKTDSDSDIVIFANNSNRWAVHLPNLEGFVEEIKEPEEFWFLQTDGTITANGNVLDGAGFVPNWLRFPTRESAQAFADGMKSTMSFKIDTVHHCDQARFLIQALNSRRHD